MKKRELDLEIIEMLRTAIRSDGDRWGATIDIRNLDYCFADVQDSMEEKYGDARRELANVVLEKQLDKNTLRQEQMMLLKTWKGMGRHVLVFLNCEFEFLGLVEGIGPEAVEFMSKLKEDPELGVKVSDGMNTYEAAIVDLWTESGQLLETLPLQTWETSFIWKQFREWGKGK